ncbi:MAG: SWIM zinc finger family protein [Bacteroidota bacterium]
MPTSLSLTDIQHLAANEAAFQRAKGLAEPRLWRELGRTKQGYWGRYYDFDLWVSLAGPSFKCSCPSRQYPCKHVLGLLLMALSQSQHWSNYDPPSAFIAWLEKQLQAKPPAKAQSARSEERLAARLANIQGGLIELDHWLQDLAQRGLADLVQQSETSWQRLIARMVDAQAPGIANRLTELQLETKQAASTAKLIDQVGQIHLLSRAMRQYSELPSGLRDELFQQVGINLRKEEVLASPPVAGRWLVLGRRLEIGDRLDVQRTWLQGQGEVNGRLALLLEFSVGSRAFPSSFQAGQLLEGPLHFYPSSLPLRALFGQEPEVLPQDALPQVEQAAEGLHRYAQALGANPWLPRYPLVVQGVQPLQPGSRHFLSSPDGSSLPLVPNYPRWWELLALSGGDRLTVMGEWDGYELYPLGARQGRRWVRV